MAKDASDDLTYYLLVDEQFKTHLGTIRHWNNLKVGFDENKIWVKDISYAQLHSGEVKIIPEKKLFYEKDGKLFPVNSLLPSGRVPSVMWTPIERAFPVRLPSLNHNFFGLDEEIDLQIVPSETEHEAVALIISVKNLQNYLNTAPEVRLKNQQWLLLDDKFALVTGLPFLPVEGKSYWERGQFLLPTGFDFEFYILT